MDWRLFVEEMSVVEHALGTDPAGTYSLMDFSTRDTYRHVVEKIARRSRAPEPEVAAVALRLTQAVADTDPQDRRAHVGYYLIDDGVVQTQAEVAAAAPRYRPARLPPRRVRLPVYLLPIAVIIAISARACCRPVPDRCRCGWPRHWRWWCSASWALCWSTGRPPCACRRTRCRGWISRAASRPSSAPLVVVPSMLSSADAIDALVEGLEVRFLANRDAQLHFALLTDFLDADQETLPGDDALLAHAARQIERLNDRYAPEQGDRFFLLHRAREWNPREHRWMGHERKRGKLAALNRLLRGGDESAFMRVAGRIAPLAQVRYVITLDTDTRLPRDAAREFVATLAHPLNRPRFDAARRRVVEGYGILQPSVGTSLGGRRSSRYARLFGSEPGIDPYTRTVSDVYLGPVWRGLVRRQGHLRRGCVRVRAG